jgi:hypothetical protein
MKTRTLTLILAAAFLAVGALSAFADTPATATASQEKGVGKVEGLVIDARTGQAVQDVYVAIDGCLNAAMTNERGQFFIKEAPSGPCVMKVAKMGYKAVEMQVTVEKKKKNIVTVQIKEAPKPVPVEEEKS